MEVSLLGNLIISVWPTVVVEIGDPRRLVSFVFSPMWGGTMGPIAGWVQLHHFKGRKMYVFLTAHMMVL